MVAINLGSEKVTSGQNASFRRGRGMLVIQLQGNNTIRLKDCLHVPGLAMSLQSIRVHHMHGNGCFFLADESECCIGFRTFTIDIDDEYDCTTAHGLPTESHTPFQQFAYDETLSEPSKLRCKPIVARHTTGSNYCQSDLERPLLSFQVHTRCQKKQRASRMT